MCSKIKIIIRGIISALLLRFNHIADAGEMVLCPTVSEIVKNPVENIPLNYSNSPEFPDN